MTGVRVRFAPSPTGALHIGGVRTALYNFLFARKTGGVFIIRIEDTDQERYVPGAEDYIMESLKWCGLTPDEGPEPGGDYGPYRQSERKAAGIYLKYAHQLIDSGHAYYAFDTSGDLDAMRKKYESEGNTFKYDSATRMGMTNSLTLAPEETEKRLANGEDHTIRLKVNPGESIVINDLIRGQVTFQSSELDDKVILKSDGMPTYHMANIVDDHLMEISHVIRGEEWLPSTAHHVLLYRYLGWEATMPQFAHLPLILKPTGKGKLSKRDGDKLGIPVFPLSWEGATAEDSFKGFREFGFLPEAVNNFLALLGWNPGTEQEIFSLEELCQAFSLERVGKSGARFDFEKAKWFNQQYIIKTPDEKLAELVQPFLAKKGYAAEPEYLTKFCGLMKERVSLLTEFAEMGYYFFENVKNYDEATIKKRWQEDRRESFTQLSQLLDGIPDFTAENIEATVKNFINDSGLKFGEVFPVLRIALTGSMSGPDLFNTIALLGKVTVMKRLKGAFEYFDGVVGIAGDSELNDLKIKIRKLADTYASKLSDKIEDRIEAMKMDDNSHHLVYRVLGVNSIEGERIDFYQNKGRFLYNYAGSFLEEAATLCLNYKYPDGLKTKIENTSGASPKTFEIDFLNGKDAIEVKWRDATTDGDHITKEHNRVKVTKSYGFRPIRIMFYYPQRDQAIKIQETLKMLYTGVGGEYYAGEEAWEFLKIYSGVDLKAILMEIANEKTPENGN